MAALSTEQLEYLLSRIVQSHALHVDVLGVFPADCFPFARLRKRNSRDACFVMNVDPHDKPGKHWTAFYYASAEHALFHFDSFGLPLTVFPSFDYTSWMRKLNLKRLVTVSSHSLQSISSQVCGHYCVLFLHKCACLRMHPTVAARKIELLSADSVKRDSAVVVAVRRLANRRGKACLPTVRTMRSQLCTCMNAWVEKLTKNVDKQ
jgi:hypothetical protein